MLIRAKMTHFWVLYLKNYLLYGYFCEIPKKFHVFHHLSILNEKLCSLAKNEWKKHPFTHFFYREMKIFQIKRLSAKKIDNDLLGFLASKVA